MNIGHISNNSLQNAKLITDLVFVRKHLQNFLTSHLEVK